MSDKSTKAFPVEGMEVGSEGMDLRDYFAAKLMPALIHESVNSGMAATNEELAMESYRLADVMMKARNL